MAEYIAFTPEAYEEQRRLNTLTRFHLQHPTGDKQPEPLPPVKSDVLMLRAPEAGIKGRKKTEFRMYGTDCQMLDVEDSENMVTAPHKDERLLKYKKASGGAIIEQFVLNPHINPVPPYAVFMARQGPRGEYFVVPDTWEVDAVVAVDFEEPTDFDTPTIVTVNLLYMEGDTDPPEDQTVIVTDVVIDIVVVRGKGLNLQKGVPCRIKTVAGTWRFAWTDCEVEDTLADGVDAPEPYPDPFEEV